MTPTEEQTYREGVKNDLTDIKDDQREMMKMVRYTNGKVRKIVIALVLIGGFVLGQSVNGVHDLIALITHIV